jgi:hypothetical protein
MGWLNENSVHSAAAARYMGKADRRPTLESDGTIADGHILAA